MSLLVHHWWGWVRHITRPGSGEYLDRYTLRKQGDSGTNPWRVYLHHFLARDSDDFHNHPSTWGFSIVLWGSYTEESLDEADTDQIEAECRFDGCPAIGVWGMHSHEYGEDRVGQCQWCGAVPPVPAKVRRVRWFNWIPATKYHRITHLHPGPGARGVWTLFVCGPLTGRGWGFYVPGQGHVDHSAKEHTKVTPADPS